MIVSSDTTSPSDENHESGLWLWYGKAPLPSLPPQPASRVQRFFDPIISALRRGGWVALPGGVALTLLAVMLRSTPPDKSAPADAPAVALEPVPSPAEAHAVIPAPPVNFPAPRVEHMDTQLDQAQMSSALAALFASPRDRAPSGEKGGASHISANRGKPSAFAGRSSPFVIHGVLTPPEPTVSRDGGH